jgi:hypothetical protein
VKVEGPIDGLDEVEVGEIEVVNEPSLLDLPIEPYEHTDFYS